MGCAKRIRRIMLEKDIKKIDVARRLDVGQQSFYNKLSRDNMSYNAVENILNLLDCDIVFRDRITGQEY